MNNAFEQLTVNLVCLVLFVLAQMVARGFYLLLRYYRCIVLFVHLYLTNVSSSSQHRTNDDQFIKPIEFFVSICFIDTIETFVTAMLRQFLGIVIFFLASKHEIALLLHHTLCELRSLSYFNRRRRFVDRGNFAAYTFP